MHTNLCIMPILVCIHPALFPIKDTIRSESIAKKNWSTHAENPV